MLLDSYIVIRYHEEMEGVSKQGREFCVVKVYVCMYV